VAYKKSNNNRFFSYINPVYSPNQASTANTNNHHYEDDPKKIDLAKRERRKLSLGFNPDKIFDPKQIFKKIRDTTSSHNKKANVEKIDQFMSLSNMRDPNSIVASDKLLQQKAYKMTRKIGITFALKIKLDPKKFIMDLNSQLENITTMLEHIRGEVASGAITNFTVVIDQLSKVLSLTMVVVFFLKGIEIE
jgi:hypothetical protein